MTTFDVFLIGHMTCPVTGMTIVPSNPNTFIVFKTDYLIERSSVSHTTMYIEARDFTIKVLVYVYEFLCCTDVRTGMVTNVDTEEADSFEIVIRYHLSKTVGVSVYEFLWLNHLKIFILTSVWGDP